MPGSNQPDESDAASPGGALGKHIKALTFDVFGTVVDWRSSVEAALAAALKAKVESPAFASLPEALQARARELLEGRGGGKEEEEEEEKERRTRQWPADFATDWRASYGRFTRSFIPGQTPWKDIDAHHLDSLRVLLGDEEGEGDEGTDGWGLAGLFTEAETLELSQVWHRLDPWPDSAEGIRTLRGGGYVTATLSNGNRSLLRDLDSYGRLGFDRIISTEDFAAYKPHPTTYLGAATALGLRPDQVAMVAAHLGDLQAARDCRLRTIYVERAAEEEWLEDEERYNEARRWVDIWIPLGKGGFVELAARLQHSAQT